jgi:hypothetical protein
VVRRLCTRKLSTRRTGRRRWRRNIHRARKRRTVENIRLIPANIAVLKVIVLLPTGIAHKRARGHNLPPPLRLLVTTRVAKIQRVSRCRASSGMSDRRNAGHRKQQQR